MNARELRQSIERARARLDYAQRPLDHELLFRLTERGAAEKVRVTVAR